MNQKYRTYLMWSLYALLFLFTLLTQTVFLGRTRFFGVRPNIMPVCVVCIAMFAGHEAGGLFSLAAALFWVCAGADGGAIALFTMTLTGILAGWLCDCFLSPYFFPALGLSAGAVLLHEGAVALSKLYLHGASLSLLRTLPLQVGVSLFACPILYFLAKAIRKVGGA